jgi:hypothetical protein
LTIFGGFCTVVKMRLQYPHADVTHYQPADFPRSLEAVECQANDRQVCERVRKSVSSPLEIGDDRRQLDQEVSMPLRYLHRQIPRPDPEGAATRRAAER